MQHSIRSLISSKNKIGLRTLPWGIPLVTSAVYILLCIYTTDVNDYFAGNNKIYE